MTAPGPRHIPADRWLEQIRADLRGEACGACERGHHASCDIFTCPCLHLDATEMETK